MKLNLNTSILNSKSDYYSLIERRELFSELDSNNDLFSYDQYNNYFFKKGFSAHKYLNHKLKTAIKNSSTEWTFFHEQANNDCYIVGVKISNWDRQHFGYGIAHLTFFTAPKNLNKPIISALIKRVNRYLKNKGVVLVLSRINGEMTKALHVLEENSYRYYETIIWPIAKSKKRKEISNVRMYKKSEIEQIKEISINNQFKSNHFYCDTKFDKTKVSLMYGEWITTAIKNENHIAIIEHDEKVVGFFVFYFDKTLNIYSGCKYGRMSLLALNQKQRGLGLGKKLFNGTLFLMDSLGAEYIDSGYSIKNHNSSRLHNKASFYAIHQEVLFHCWL